MDKYEIEHTTEKGLKIKKEGITFWIPKIWRNNDGSLDFKALKAFKEAKRKYEEEKRNEQN